jgi:hypothetical protein
MQKNLNFSNLNANFWANVKLLSQKIGYTAKATRKGETSSVRIPSKDEILKAYNDLSLDPKTLEVKINEKTFLEYLREYFTYRADILNNEIESNLMNKSEAEKIFKNLYKEYLDLKLNCPLPLNKQKNEKSGYALLTCMVNILIAKELGDLPCNYDPHSLSYFTKDSFLIRTLSRRIDGAFPDIINPLSIWEIKEYYNTTTFGSRIADGVYETLMDGMELKELSEKESLSINHLLIIDAYDTWWLKGKSYLCRIIDMLNMGLVTEVLFGKEIITRIPEITKDWKSKYPR